MPLALNKPYCSSRYVLRRRLDRDSLGAFSAVYLADDRADKIQVAVKESLARTDIARRRFERERRIQTRLGGQNIVRVLGADEFGSSRCLILEYLAGGSLAEEATRARLSPEQAPSIVADVLRGLNEAHAAGIVHRDLKPGNVLLDAQDHAKLADFGSAFEPSEPPLTRPAEVLGTDDWMAPQQAAGRPADRRDDIFSAGLLLYDLLTGDPPRMSRQGWRPRLDHIDERYREIVRRATAGAREDRYPSASAMLADLEQARGRPRPPGQRPAPRLSLEDLRLLTDADRVRSLFRKLGYPVTQDSDFVSLSPGELELHGSAAELVAEGWTLAAFGDDLFVILLRLRDTSGSTISRVVAQFRARAQFLLVCTDTFDRFVFVNPRPASAGGTPRLHKLVVDRAHPTRHAHDVLEQLACTTTAANEVFQQQCAAFDVEHVTNKFYREYAALLRSAIVRIREWNRGLQMVYDAERLNAYSQRLFSRILFLYFLQRKGWLAGQQDFLTRRYQRAVSEEGNFFHDVLTPLFFEVLNTDRPNGQSRFGAIPYLNGGLFEKGRDDDELIHIGNELFDAGSDSGILGFLDNYDFTIEEDTPTEIEVALDPEMLGKVFENLLEEEERGKSGVFYTPRPIVHYMCRESLLAYLLGQTSLPEGRLRELFVDQDGYQLSAREVARVDDALSRVRIVDPAVGSGAFLVGMLQLMVQVRRSCKAIRQAEVIRTGAEVAGWKREFIQRCLYGVDIKPEAVEIARLRLWLSLVVDLEMEIRDVEPLPNLDYRIVTGNSLLESFDENSHGGDARNGRLELESAGLLGLRRSMAEQREAYFTETDPAGKVTARREIEEKQARVQQQWLRDRLDDLKRESEWLIASLAAGGGRKGAARSAQRIQEQIDRYQSLLNRSALGNQLPFSYRLNFSEIFDRQQPGFDIVIANPPYVNVQKVNNLDYVTELKTAYGWLDDLYVHFLFRGFELARAGGIVVYITADTYLTIGTKQRLRDRLLENRLDVLARCDPFDATVDTAVLLARKQMADANDTLFFANGNRRKPAVFDELGPVDGWTESREVLIGDERRSVRIGPSEPLPRYIAPLLLYRRTLKHAFFEPSPFNLALYERFMPAMRALYEAWWPRIDTSAAMTRNATAVAKYCDALKPGEITLLGLVTEGGVGLQTSDNPRFLAHLRGTAWGDRDERFLAAREEHWRTREPGIWREYQELLRTMPRYEAVDALRRSFGGARLGIGRMALYRTIGPDEVADPAELSEDEKRNGIGSTRCWVPFRKGDRAGNRWLSDEPLFIKWDRETVRYFYANSGKKNANMPVVRNPQMYFQELVTFDRRIRDSVIKGRMLPACVFDAGTPAFRSMSPAVPETALLAILNSPVSTGVCKSFLNNTNFETSDFRALPVVVPTPSQRQGISTLVAQVMEIQRRVLAREADRAELEPVEAAINAEVFGLYGIDMALAPAGWDKPGDDADEAGDGAEGADE